MAKNVLSTDLAGNTYRIPAEKLEWRPAAYGIVVHGKALLLVKAKGGYHLPGGGLNKGEFPNKSVVREVKEETGIEADNPRLIDVLTTFFAFDAYGSQEMRHVQSLLFYYSCTFTGGELTTVGLEGYEAAEGIRPEWVPVEDLSKITVGTSVDWRPVVAQAIC